MWDRQVHVLRALRRARSEAELRDILHQVSREMGFAYFALTQHVDILQATGTFIRLDNYPPEWVRWFDAEKLGPCDPVHRASHVTCAGFIWSELENLIPLTRRDLFVLERAGRQGIGNGFTVPANVPGESFGSCSFATASGAPLPMRQLLFAQSIAPLFYETARIIRGIRDGGLAAHRPLTDRQRDCVVCVGRGLGNRQIAETLGVTKVTAIEHLKDARDRYGVQTRCQLVVHALLDGTICLTDLVRR